eukprot:scaffold128948_cov42-Phaeocystis_antarctica.AAC.2
METPPNASTTAAGRRCYTRDHRPAAVGVVYVLGVVLRCQGCTPPLSLQFVCLEGTVWLPGKEERCHPQGSRTWEIVH